MSSGSELLQALEQNDFAKACVAPAKGIKKSSFFEAINTCGLEQLSEVFNHLVKQVAAVLPAEYAHLGNLVSIDGSLMDAVLSMEWADRCAKKTIQQRLSNPSIKETGERSP